MKDERKGQRRRDSQDQMSGSEKKEKEEKKQAYGRGREVRR